MREKSKKLNLFQIYFFHYLEAKKLENFTRLSLVQMFSLIQVIFLVFLKKFLSFLFLGFVLCYQMEIPLYTYVCILVCGFYFFYWKRHRDILIDKKKYKKKDKKSSRQRKLNYKKLHCKTSKLSIKDHSLWSAHR